MAFEEPADPRREVDVADGGGEARPGTGVFCELRVAGLEEDFDPVEGADYGFCLLFICLVRLLYSL